MHKSSTALVLDRMGLVAEHSSSLSPCFDMDTDGDARSMHSGGPVSPTSCAATAAIDIPTRCVHMFMQGPAPGRAGSRASRLLRICIA